MRDTAAPMPRVPPVTIATRPAMISSLVLHWNEHNSCSSPPLGGEEPDRCVRSSVVLQSHSSAFCGRRNCRAVPDNDAPALGHRTATMKPFTALFGAAAGTHTADQLALATLPLTATLVL